MSDYQTTLTTPIYVAVGAGDLAYRQATDFVLNFRERTESVGETATARYEDAKNRLANLSDELPGSVDELREKVDVEELKAKATAEELRKLADPYIEVVTELYKSLAERGEGVVEKLRTQTVVKENLDRVEKAYTDAVELTEDALGVVSARTRAVGEKDAALAGRAGESVEDAALAVEDAAVAITEAGGKVKEQADEAAKTIDSAAKTAAAKAPAKTAAKKAPAKTAAKKAPAKTAATKAPAKKA